VTALEDTEAVDAVRERVGVAVVRAWLEGEPEALRARITHTIDLADPEEVSVAAAAGSSQACEIVRDWLVRLEGGDAASVGRSGRTARATPSVSVRKYDPRWPEFFEVEAASIRDALGDAVIGIEHVGGTSVPGLRSKGVIDILVGLRFAGLTAGQVAALRALGYRRVRVRQTGRVYLRKGSPRTHTIHVVEWGGEAWRASLRFRDLLRGNRDEALRYGALKRSLARQAGANRAFYAEEKGRFIQQALARTG
jgi:GrpB-like predicted nucleotidyltransferase (UPF0157 family)